MLTLVLSDYMKCFKYKQGKAFHMCLCFLYFFIKVAVRMGRSGQYQDKYAINEDLVGG